MENASQALIIAGSILIAMLVLSVGVYLVSSYSQVGTAYEERQTSTELSAFNSRFFEFEGRTDITAQEIITLKKYIEDYNTENDPDITLTCNPNINNDIEFLKSNSTKNDSDGKIKTQYFKCERVEADENTGKVKSITFSKNL